MEIEKNKREHKMEHLEIWQSSMHVQWPQMVWTVDLTSLILRHMSPSF